MDETVELGDILIFVTRKRVKHVHLSVYPPNGRVTMVAPEDTRLEVAHAYAASRLGWIRKQQEKLRAQARETPRQFIERESHYIWGRRYLLSVIERDEKPSVRLDHRHITLTVRHGSSQERREALMRDWQSSLVREAVRSIVLNWEPKLEVKVSNFFLQRMKTKWGGCNPRAGHIRINTELVRKPKDLLEYVVVHEMVHLIESSHNERFENLMNLHYPSWREARIELNELPLSAQEWKE